MRRTLFLHRWIKALHKAVLNYYILSYKKEDILMNFQLNIFHFLLLCHTLSQKYLIYKVKCVNLNDVEMKIDFTAC